MICVHRITLLLLGIAVLVNCSPTPNYHKGSNNPIGAPVAKTPFESYVTKTEQQILQVLLAKQMPSNYQCNKTGNPCSYSPEDAANMRAPFQRPSDATKRCLDNEKGAQKGFLLVHGLTDSPYLMRGLADSIEKTYPCSLIRAIVLPGHSTIPGDSLEMTHQDWMDATEYGVRSFDNIDSIDSIYVMSFSTGAPLLIRHIAEREAKRKDTKIKAGIFVSAAIQAKTSLAKWSPFVQYFYKWLDKTNEQDAARYESFSTHAGAEFYHLTKVLDEKDYQFTIPLFMVISADDATISPKAALNYFCDADTKNKMLLWYEYEDSENPISNFKDKIGEDCYKKIDVRDTDAIGNKPDYYKSFAHTSLSMPPSDEHYGSHAKYKLCKHYYKSSDSDDDKFTRCVTAKSPNYVIGEVDDKALEDWLKKNNNIPWRRGTYNPDYQYMEKQIFEFIENLP